MNRLVLVLILIFVSTVVDDLNLINLLNSAFGLGGAGGKGAWKKAQSDSTCTSHIKLLFSV